MNSPSLSRREKLLLWLLTSTLIFSASFSYGAVNQSKVDSIMQTINNAASNFSSQADRDTYYNRVYTGLSDAIDMLAVVRNNVGAMIGTPPVSVSPGNPGGSPNENPATSPGNTGNGVFIYRVKSASSQTDLDRAFTDVQSLQCISSLDELRRINPDTIGPNNPNGYDYSTYKWLGKDCYFNVKDHKNVIAWSKNPEVKNRPANIPDSCRIGTKFVAYAESGIVLAECVSREYAYGIGKSSPNCTDDPKAIVFDLNKMRGNSTFTIEWGAFNEASYAKWHYGILKFTKGSEETLTPEIISVRIDLRDGKFDPDVLPKKITDIPSYYQNDESPTWGANWFTDDKLWQRYDQVSTELTSLSQCAGDFTSPEARLIGGYRSDTPISSVSQLVMGQLDHPYRKLQLLEWGPSIINSTKSIFLQPGSVWYLNYRVRYGTSRAAPYDSTGIDSAL